MMVCAYFDSVCDALNPSVIIIMNDSQTSAIWCLSSKELYLIYPLSAEFKLLPTWISILLQMGENTHICLVWDQTVANPNI